MKIVVENEKRISTMNLPEEISGNYWIEDITGKKLVNVDAEDGNWVLKSNNDIKLSFNQISDDISNVSFIENDTLKLGGVYYAADLTTHEKYAIFALPEFEEFKNFIIDYNVADTIVIGGDATNSDIGIANQLFTPQELTITFVKETRRVVLKNLNPGNRLYLNTRVGSEVYLSSGDVIFTGGLFIYYFGSLLLVSTSKGNVTYNQNKMTERITKPNPDVDYTECTDVDMPFFSKDQYFLRPPRFKRAIEDKTFAIDPPTAKASEEEMPLIFTIAPMITMGLTSMISGITAIQKIQSGESTFKDQAAAIITCGAMLASMVLFPLVQKWYDKFRRKRNERKRVIKYGKYIDSKKEEIKSEIAYQKSVLEENNLPLEDVKNLVLNRDPKLWARKLEHDDFLELRLGLGNKNPDVKINVPEEHFTLEEDDLKDLISDLVKENKTMTDIPITMDFRKYPKIGIVGEDVVVNSFFDSLMLQIMAYHGYDMLRIVILTNDSNSKYWNQYKSIPYLWNNEKSVRYYATNKDDINKVTGFLMEEYNYRVQTLAEAKTDKAPNFTPYYLVLTDDIGSLTNNAFVNEILNSKINLGYSLVVISKKINDVPDECSMFINVTQGGGGIFTNELSPDSQISFRPDFPNFSLKSCITQISNIPLDINSGKFVLPKKYGFLEMYDVGNVNQLNILNRWKDNNIIKSLEAPVGIDEQGELFKLDLHEKAHGPHGLVAGMTGSGKSEWIITYLLSMAINYSPEEVQFVLIDYKGGGLALTFDNRETGVKLPHVVGTLTNLDVVEMKRSLASINSELKRRQNMFKEAREKLNESSMDIYKYQELYRAGKLEEPMSHLFIVSDEFAELKSQQPEFMDELISTARIGRSLGVHLILATQKPSGVVDDQIWSNSKFRVCLKVQDKSDSMDMLKRPEAAFLKETGRFYLQVGFNEFFALGQSAYAGMPYYESEKKVSVVDSTIDFVDEIGSVIKKGNIEKTSTQTVNKGEELANILNYIIEVAKGQELKITPLWLSSIPKEIFVDKIKTKYEYKKENYVLNPIIGEYDAPHKQEQDILTLPLSKEGNFIIYGASGSGKELFFTTMLYSLITTYTPMELSVYIIDLGTEVLSSFAGAPQIGDIVHSGDDEKLANLLKFVKDEISTRRKLFLQYNGSFELYNSKAEKKVPNIVVLINEFETFSELYQEEAESLYEITRDCNKFGIYFGIAALSSNGIRSKLAQTFKNIYALQLTDEYDYKALFGNTSMVPTKTYGRGIFMKDRALEFQTAYPYDKEEMYSRIKDIANSYANSFDVKASQINVLPEQVSLSDIKKGDISINNIPIGMIKNDLSPAVIKLRDELSCVIGFREFEENLGFINCFLNVLENAKEKVYVLDAKYTYEESPFKKIKYYNNNFLEPLDKLEKFVNDLSKVLSENNNNIRKIKEVEDGLCVIIGFEKFIEGLGDKKEQFVNILTKGKDVLKLHFIFIDVPSGFKDYEYESWYKDSIDSSSGVWIGDGFADQYLIKPTKLSQDFYALIGKNYGYKVDKGQVKFIKIIEKNE